MLTGHGERQLAWYGVWLFTDWMPLDAADDGELTQIAEVELEASRRDPYRRLSRAFHLLARKLPGPPCVPSCWRGYAATSPP